MVLSPFALARNALGSKTGFRSGSIREFLDQGRPEKPISCGGRTLCVSDRGILCRFLQKSRAIARRELPPNLSDCGIAIGSQPELLLSALGRGRACPGHPRRLGPNPHSWAAATRAGGG